MEGLKFCTIFIIFVIGICNFVKCTGVSNSSGIIVHVGLGDPCTNPSECDDPSKMWCNAESKCACRNEFVQVGPECFKIAEFEGDKCEHDEQCTKSDLGDHSYCYISTACVCKPDTTTVPPDFKKCYEVISKVGGECEIDQQCQIALGGYSACEENDQGIRVCICNDKSMQAPGEERCIPLATKLDDACEVNQQCEALGPSECSSTKTCTCTSAGVPKDDNTKCLDVINNLGGDCVQDNQCTSGTPGLLSKCINLKCRCGVESINAPGKHECLKFVNEIGGECEDSIQCRYGLPGAHSECKTNGAKDICQCSSGAINEVGKHKCYPIANAIGEGCEVNAQCDAKLSSAYCTGGKCSCINNEVPSEDHMKCMERKGLGEVCEDLGQCNAEDSNRICHDKQCQCNPLTSLLYNGQCFEYRKNLGESCELEGQCETISGSKCISKKCECNPDSHIINTGQNACLQLTTQLDGLCEVKGQCKKISNSECQVSGSEMRCACIEGHVSSETLHTCLEVARDLNETCEESIQCTTNLGENAICSTKSQCECKDNHVFANKQCHKVAKFGESCMLHEECEAAGKFVECSAAKRCACMAKTKEINETCWEEKIIGSACETVDQCKNVISGPSTCDSTTKKCECEEGYSSMFAGALCSDASNRHTSISILMVSLLITLKSMTS